MNQNYRKPLQSTQLEYFDVRQAVEDIQPGAYQKLPYTSKVLAEQLVRRCDPAILEQSLKETNNAAAEVIDTVICGGDFLRFVNLITQNVKAFLIWSRICIEMRIEIYNHGMLLSKMFIFLIQVC